MKLRSKPIFAAVSVLLCALAAWAFQAARQAAAPPPPSLTAMLPQGALLTIESPDFAALLHSWNASPEQKAWLASDNNRVFSNSRLFGRLNDARTEFEAAATPPKGESPSFDGDFLTQVAGRQSIFAWYDIGNLEFLYITRISSAQAANISLLKQRAGWSVRQSAGVTFYLRKTSSADAASDSAQGKARTVAFAQDNGLLILATREDLIANALALIHPAPNAQSVATEPWYAEVSAALAPQTPAPGLHMVLNLDRLTRLAYFRSYWVQGNISQMQQYRAAVSDLYLTPAQFREERALLPADPDSLADEADVASLAALAPASNGVYRARATSDPDEAVAALEEKLLGRIALADVPSKSAPDPSLDAPQSGSSTDLETRVDTPAPVSEAVSNRALADALKAASLDAILTYSTAQPPATAAGLWVPIHSAVVLHAKSAWNPQALQTALQQS